MKSKRILVPIDLMRSPGDALAYARGMAVNQIISVTLLYVLNLNINVPDKSVYAQLRDEAEMALRKLARLFFGTDHAVRIVVREGVPHEEILAEANSIEADVILLSTPEKRSWKNFLRRCTAQKIIDAAVCPAVVLPRSRQNPSNIRSLPACPEGLLAEAV